MKRHSDGLRLLHDLIDRYERNPASDRRFIARPSLAFGTAEDRMALRGILEAASDTGAVTLRYDRDAPHLIASVTLIDAPQLYAHLNRTPAPIGVASAVAQLEAYEPTTEVGIDLQCHFVEGWQAGRRPMGLDFSQTQEATKLVRAADAAFTQLVDPRISLRSRSARLLGDSKALEHALPKLLAYLRHNHRIAPDLTRHEALRVLGLEKYPQPILIAGPIAVGEASVANWSYAGLPPEAETQIVTTSRPRSILTIENLESFNRHVRECRLPEEIVIYTGGFPGPIIVSILLRLIEQAPGVSVWHWGDIDHGGVRIAAFLESSLPIPVRPHLMTRALAASFGRTTAQERPTLTLGATSAFADLAEYLNEPNALTLEQEVLDPEPIEEKLS